MTTEMERAQIAWRKYPGQFVCFFRDEVVMRVNTPQELNAFREAYSRDPQNKGRTLHIVHPAGLQLSGT